LVHRLIPGGGLLERQLEVVDPAGVDLAIPDQVDEPRQEAAYGCRAAVQVDVAEEQLLTRELDAVGDADVTDVPAAVAARGGS
jgi:hypothetical protein